MLPILLSAIAITASFEGGSIGKVEHVAPNYLRCAVRGQADNNHRNRQANWYYFRLDGLPRGEVRIDFTDLVGEYNFRPGAHAVTRNTRPVYSYDGHTWTHFTDRQVDWNDTDVVLTVRFKASRRQMWIAHMAPYTGRELALLLNAAAPVATAETIGRSAHGRAISLLTITDRTVPEQHKKVVWIVARQHAWEAGTSWVADGAVRFLVSKDPEAARLRRTTVFKIMPVFDPDGVAEGAVRFNVSGYDNNRNWDRIDPPALPEIEALRRSVASWVSAGRRIDFFLALHNTESSDYLEGPANPYHSLAQSVVDRLRETTNFYDPLSPRNSMAAAIDPGRYMIHQYLFTEDHIPAFLMELMVESNPRLGRLRTSGDFSNFGGALVRILGG